MTSLGDVALIFLVSAASCLVVGRGAIRALARAQYVAPLRYEDCPPLMTYQQGKQQIPTMGGLFVLGAGILVAAAAGGLAHQDGWLVLGVVLGMGAVGLFDDCLKFRHANAAGLRGWPKLLIALAIGAALGLASSDGSTGAGVLDLPWTHRTIALGWGRIPFAMLVVAGCAHAVNLTDGMDGLAAGCVAVALSALGLWAMRGDPHSRVVVPWCASLAGACVGFLWFNSFPASVYLGDVGALELPWMHRTIALGWGWIPFAMLVVAGCAHAVNLTDGMDGLAAGCVAVALSVLGLWAMRGDGHSRIVVPWCASLAGACVGFLWFNSFPASVYLGDVGALGLGAALGVISLLTRTALWLVIIGGVFVVEALSVMLQVVSYKWRGKRRVFRVAPLHHHFHLGGTSEPKLIVRFWIIGVMLAMLSLTTALP